MTDETSDGPQEALYGPQGAQEVSGGEVAGRDRDRGAQAASGGSGAACIHPEGYDGECPCPSACACCRVEAATPSSGWTPLSARAFNAVQPALRTAGEWLPLSARRAVADAVLAVVQPELQQLAALRTVARGYCPHCGRGDAAPTVEYSEQQRQRADQAEAAIARVRALADRWDNALAPDRTYARALRAALDEPAPDPAATEATDGPACTCGGRFPIQHLHADQHKPTAHDGGPTVAEAAADDRAHWNQRQWGGEPA